MKKLVMALVFAIALAPLSAFGLEMMTDGDMKDTTAQAGVAIAIDDVILEQFIGETKYIDSDGVTGDEFAGMDGASSLGGALVIGQRHKFQMINAIYTGSKTIDENALDLAASTDQHGINDIQICPWDDEKEYLQAENFGEAGSHGYDTVAALKKSFVISPLTIDIGTCAVLSDGLVLLKAKGKAVAAGLLGTAGGADEAKAAYNKNYKNRLHLTWDEVNAGTDMSGTVVSAGTKVVGVCINLPTVEIHTLADTYSIKAQVVNADTGALYTDDDNNQGTYFNNDREYIRIHKGASSLGILGGRLEIAPK